MGMKTKSMVFAGVALLLVGGVRGAQIEKPAVLANALVTLTASDLHGLIDGIGTVAAQVQPMFSGGMLKALIGSQLGDPQLDGFAPGKGLAVVMLDPETIFAVVEINETQRPMYVNQLTALNMASSVTNGLVVVGQTPAVVEKGMAMATQVQTQLLSKRTPALRVAMKPSESLAGYEQEIQGMLAMMPMMLGPQMSVGGADPATTANLLRIVEGEIHVILSVAKQVGGLEVSVLPADGSILISEVLEPVAGSRLATLCNAPAVNSWNSKLVGLLNDGAVKVEFCLENPEALTAFVTGESDELIKTMSIDEAAVKSYLDMMTKSINALGGTFCESIRFNKTGFGFDVISEVKDAAAILAMMKSTEQNMAAFLKLYEETGVPMTFAFAENAVEHNGVKIHRMTTGITMPEGQDEAGEVFQAMGLEKMVFDFAFCDGVMVGAMGEGRIGSLIDQVKAGEKNGTALKARSAHPQGGCLYVDYSVEQYLDFISSLMPSEAAEPFPQLVAMLKGVDPITYAGYRADGRVMVQLKVPGDLIAKIAQAAMVMQAESADDSSDMEMDFELE